VKGVAEVMVEDYAEDMRNWGLIWEIEGDCPCYKDEKVEQNTKRCYRNGDRCNGGVNFPKEAGECRAEE